ncbi:MAG: DUF4142 domain-containing protein [Cellvibrionaceae bacterium]|nr:DUF4142 domain-containing protein [Cellvibrionaceae bacterium]
MDSFLLIPQKVKPCLNLQNVSTTKSEIAMKYFRLLLTSLILSCANAALADDTSVQQKFIDTPVDPQVFVEKAYASGLTEIELANNALQKSTHEEVRHFAQMMIEGHTQINNDLRTLANAEGLNIPSEATLLKKAKARMLALKKGESFESSYAGHQVESHEQSYKALPAGGQITQLQYPQICRRKTTQPGAPFECGESSGYRCSANQCQRKSHSAGQKYSVKTM